MMTVLPLLCSLSLMVTAPTRQDVITFRVDVRTVYIDVFVTRNGKQVTGLGAEDFEVYDNGVKQTVQLADTEGLALSVLLLLDTSGSITGSGWNQLGEAAVAFTRELGGEDETALLTFSRRASLRMGFGEEGGDALYAAVADRGERGPTALNEALFFGLNVLESREGRPLALILTDGIDNASWLSAESVLQMARSSEAVVYALFVTPLGRGTIRSPLSAPSSKPEGTEQFLSDLTRATGGRLIRLDSTKNLGEDYLEILAEMKTRYLLAFEPQGVSDSGWHRLEVRLPGKRGTQLRARSGYQAKP